MKPRHTARAAPAHPVHSARAAGLRYVTDEQPGLRRIKSGQGFRYVDSQGKPVHDKKCLRRIRALSIPPAWTDVWICPGENGHLQATGRDAKGRKQHRYHPLWREVRDATKYNRMIEFAQALPKIRRCVARDLGKTGLTRERVLATIVRLMDVTFLRVGNEEYARNNNSFGLTTLKDRHARVCGTTIRFQFRGKSGQHHEIEVADRRLARMVKKCRDIPGQDLFQFYDAEGRRRDVTSGDVNEYLREIGGTDFTAKDFRTWAGTVLAAKHLKAAAFKTQRQAQKNIKRAVAHVAEKLGNTPAVCRKCYVHPLVLDGYLKQSLSSARNGNSNRNAAPRMTVSRGGGVLDQHEQAVLEFLRCCRREERRKLRGTRGQWRRIPAAWRPRSISGER